MKYNAEVIGNIIKKEREKRELSQKQLGAKIGITGKQISNYEHGTPIPPIDILFKLCEIFDCELGYLLGEHSYSEGTQLQTAMCEALNLSTASIDTITKITGSDRSSLSFGFESEKYIRIFNNLLSSSTFLYFIESIGVLDDCVNNKNNLFNSIEEKYGKSRFEEAFTIYYGHIDYEHDPHAPKLPSDISEIIREISRAEDQSYNLSYSIKVAKYELQEVFQDLITELYPRK